MWRAWLLAVVALSGCADRDAPPEPLRLSVMTFNAWGAGSNQGKSVDETIAVLRAVDADVVGLQEVLAEADNCEADDCPATGPGGIAARLAESLGYELYEQRGSSEVIWANAILSRYPITEVISDELGVVIDVEDRRVAVVNIHLTDYPYQPYQLLGIPYADAPMLDSEADAVRAAREARGSAVDRVLGALATLDDVHATVITGDFNEPSHRDWTARAADIGRHPIAVRYPTLQAMEKAAFTDAWRAVHPDEIAAPGNTWTPTTAADDPGDHHDRIDYVLVRGPGVDVTDARVVGESPANADIVVESWPSDHRAVVATVSIPRIDKQRRR